MNCSETDSSLALSLPDLVQLYSLYVFNLASIVPLAGLATLSNMVGTL